MTLFEDMSQVRAVVILLKELNVDNNYLNDNGFAIASMLIGTLLDDNSIML